MVIFGSQCQSEIDTVRTSDPTPWLGQIWFGQKLIAISPSKQSDTRWSKPSFNNVKINAYGIPDHHRHMTTLPSRLRRLLPRRSLHLRRILYQSFWFINLCLHWVLRSKFPLDNVVFLVWIRSHRAWFREFNDHQIFFHPSLSTFCKFHSLMSRSLSSRREQRGNIIDLFLLLLKTHTHTLFLSVILSNVFSLITALFS